MLCGVSASIAALILGSTSFAVPGCTKLRTDGLSNLVPGNKLHSHGKLISIDQLSSINMHIRADKISMRMYAAVGCSTALTEHENISRSVWKWAQKGFPPRGRVNVDLCIYMCSIIRAWLMPKAMEDGTSHIHKWNLGASLDAMNNLCDKKEFNYECHQPGVMLRGVGVGVQSSVLLNSSALKHRCMFCECVQACIWNPENFLEMKSGVYYMWAHQQHVKYDEMQLNSLSTNSLIAFGLVPKQQEIARLGSLLTSHLSHYHTLRTFVIVQVMVLDHLSGGASVGIYVSIWCLLSEVVLLGGPQKWVKKALRSALGRQVSSSIVATCFLGRVSKLYDWLDFGHLLDHFCAQNRMCKTQKSYAIDCKSQLLDPQGSVVLANSLAMDANSDEGKEDELPSVGSAGHFEGTCRHCAFLFKDVGCKNGRDCNHCHFCGPEEIQLSDKLRKRAQKEHLHQWITGNQQGNRDDWHETGPGYIAKCTDLITELEAGAPIAIRVQSFWGRLNDEERTRFDADFPEFMRYIQSKTTDEGKMKKKKRKKSSSSYSEVLGSSVAEKKKVKMMNKVKKKCAMLSTDNSDWMKELKEDAIRKVEN